MDNKTITNIILSSLIHNEEFTKKSIPYIEPSFFEEQQQSVFFKKFKEFYIKYNKIPSKDTLEVELENDHTLSQNVYVDAKNILESLYEDKVKEKVLKLSDKWLTETAEKYIQQRALFNAITESVGILDSKQNLGTIPDLIKKALAVSFDVAIGHDYLEDAELRLDTFLSPRKKLSRTLTMLNKIMNGGYATKTLNIYVGGTNVGKTSLLCFEAAADLLAGRNVLYITLEMSEEEISRRIDANVLDIPMEDIQKVEKNTFLKKIEAIKKKTVGKLIVKEYPTGGGSVLNFQVLLNELWLKKNFKPDIIYVDYINIMASSRVKHSVGGTYLYVKSICEELRGFGVEHDVPIVSATQTNRDGQCSSDFDLTEVAESHGLSQTADLVLGIMVPPDLERLGQMRLKQLKSRYGPKDKPSTFLIGMNRTKNQYYDVANKAPEDEEEQKVSDDIPVADRGSKHRYDGFKFE